MKKLAKLSCLVLALTAFLGACTKKEEAPPADPNAPAAGAPADAGKAPAPTGH